MARIMSLIFFFSISQALAMPGEFDETSYASRAARKLQNFSYQILAATGWDSIMSGFKPARIKAMKLLELQPTDTILVVGAGSGLDLEALPETATKEKVWALDYSSEMIKKAKGRAQLLGIPEDHCILGDAQALPFTEVKFEKIVFPLSLGSIPNPILALKEAERVLSPRGKIVVFEKLVDDDESISYFRWFMNLVTRVIFADINRNLTQMMGPETPLKIVHYETAQGQISGVLGRFISPYYRLSTLVRKTDYPDIPSQGARLKKEKTD